SAEWVCALCEACVDRAGHQRKSAERDDHRDGSDQCRPAHGHFTAILLANWAPKSLPALSELKNCSPSCWPCTAVSPARGTSSLHLAGAPESRTGSFSAKAKSTNQVGS